MSRVKRAMAIRPKIAAAVPTHRDGDGGGSRQAHAPAHRRPPQANGRAGRQAADRPCPRPACAQRGSRRWWSTSIISPTCSKRISRAAPTASRSTISDERDLLLETGGGMVRAEPLIEADPFLVVNSDNYLGRRPDRRAAPARLALGRRARWTRCSCWCRTRAPAIIAGRAISTWPPTARLRRRGKGRVAPFVFTGIQIVSKRLLRDAPEGPFSTNILWDRAIAEGRCFGAVHQGAVVRRRHAAVDHRDRGRADRWLRRRARPAVFTIPTHRSFADALVAGVLRQHGRDPLVLARGRILLPNNRAVRSLTDAFVRASGGGLVLPRLIAIGDPELDDRHRRRARPDRPRRADRRRRSIRSNGRLCSLADLIRAPEGRRVPRRCALPPTSPGRSTR